MIKITLEADGFNTEIITDKDISELGIQSITTLIIGWLSMFYPELFSYTLTKNSKDES